MKKIIFLIFIFLFNLGYQNHVDAHEHIMSFLFGGTTTQYNGYVQNTNNILNTVAPDYFDINPDGSLNYQKLDTKFIENMHSKNLQVTPFLSNHWDRNLGIAALNNTEGITNQIVQVINSSHLDGINIDIENVTQLHREAYTNFVKRLREKMPNKVITVSVAANPNGWTTGWHGSYDYTNLSHYSDYLMIMGYDESFYGGPAGPVASISFAEKSIIYALKYAPADKLVLGVPFFGRFWKQGDAVGGIGITNLDIQNLIQKYQTQKTYHSDTHSAQLKLVLKEGEIMPKLWGGRTLTPGTYDIWYDDNTSTKYKLDLVEKYKLKGSGSWALGEDIQEVWTHYAAYKTSAPPAQPVIQNGTYRIENINSNKVLDVYGYNYGVADIRQNQYEGGNNQIFQFERLEDGSYRIMATHSGMYLDVNGASSADGASIITYPWTGANNQRFYLEEKSGGHFMIRSKQSGKVVDISGISIANGAKVQQWQQNNSTAQLFSIIASSKNPNNHPNWGVIPDGFYNIQNKRSLKMLDVPGFSVNNGTSLIQYQRNHGNNQKFYFKHVGNDAYQLTAAHSNKALDISGVSTANGAPLIQWSSNLGADNQKFYIEPYGNYYMLRAKHSNLMIDIHALSLANGAKAQQWQQNFSDAQLFYLTKSEVSSNQNDSVQANKQVSATRTDNPEEKVPATLAVNNPSENIIKKGWFSEEEYDKNKIATRADIIKIIMRMATNLPDPNRRVANFADTMNHPDKNFILKAKYYGIVEGDKLNRFYPDQPITKEQFVILLDRVFSLPDTVDFDSNRIKDIVKTGEGEGFYAINKYLEHKIITIDDQGNFYPNHSLTMGEIAIIADRMAGVGIKNLTPIQYKGQKQKQKILEPR